MARGTVMFDFFLLLTVSTFILSANAKAPTMLDRARKLIDLNGFDVSSLMGGLQNSDGGDSPDLEDVAKNAPALMAMAGIDSPAPGSSLEEDVAKNAPAILAGLQTFQQQNEEAASEDSGSDLFEGLDNFRDSLNKEKSASPAAAPIPAKGQEAKLAPSPAKGQEAKLAPTPQASKSAQSPSQPAAGPARSTIAMGPSVGSRRTAHAPSSGNGHIAVSPATVDKDADDTAKAPSAGKVPNSGY